MPRTWHDRRYVRTSPLAAYHYQGARRDIYLLVRCPVRRTESFDPFIYRLRYDGLESARRPGVLPIPFHDVWLRI